MSDYSWLWQAAVWDWIFVPLGGILLAYLRKKNPDWAGVVIYGLGGSAFIAMILFALIGRPVFSSPRPTPENIEANARLWLDHFHEGVSKLDSPDSYFALGVTAVNSGRVITISRPKAYDNYLAFSSTLVLSAEDQAVFNNLTPEEKNKITNELSLEMARAKLAFFFNLQAGRILLTDRLPITGYLTEDTFMRAMDSVDDGTVTANAALFLLLNPYRKAKRTN